MTPGSPTTDTAPPPTAEAAVRAEEEQLAADSRAGAVADSANAALGRARQLVRERPWVALGVALGAGALLGGFVKK